MRSLVVLTTVAVSLGGTARLARADAVLSSSAGNQFPSDIAVTVNIRAQVEVTTMVLTFAPLAEAGDFVLTVPSPKNAYVVGVDVDRGAGWVQAPMVGEAPPPAIGGSSSAADPVVAAWLGTTPLRADLADLQAGPLRVRVRFQRLLRRYRGAVELVTGVARCPLRAAGDGPPVSTQVNLTTARVLTSLDVVGEAQIEQGTTSATITAQGQLTSDAMLEIRYVESSPGINVTFLTHRTPSADPLGGTDGYFLLIVDAEDSDPELAQPRTLSLVIDRSGSMAGAKIAQARAAATAMLEHLGDGDRFNVITFNDQSASMAGAPVTASEANLAAARSYIDGIVATDGTNLNDGVLAGLMGAAAEPSRFDALVLLSDGMATSGETNNTRIHDNVRLANTAKARVFTFSVGSDADLPLMEALARSNRGRHVPLNNAQATTELVERVRQLFQDIRMVRLTDLELELAGAGASEFMPEQMQDLFSGGQAIIVGRYSTAGVASVRLGGDDNGAPFLRYIDVDVPAQETGNEFIKYLWATEKVGKLLADMSRGGDMGQLQTQIIELGLAYRIQTPYTSFTTNQPTSGGGSGGGGGGSGGGGGGGGDSWGGGANTPVELVICAVLVAFAVVRRRRRLQQRLVD